MNIKFVIPVIVEEVTDRCLETYDLDWKQLILVDNSKNSFAKKYEGRGTEIHYYPNNLGVSASWNIGVKSDAEFLWIVSSSMIFNKGFSELVEATNNLADEYGLLSDHGWHCIGFTRKTFGIVGMFDEEFYPGYFEDNSYAYRLKINNIHNIGNHNIARVDINATCQGTALALKAGVVHPEFTQLRELYKKMWGGYPGEETYLTKFNK